MCSVSLSVVDDVACWFPCVIQCIVLMLHVCVCQRLMVLDGHVVCVCMIVRHAVYVVCFCMVSMKRMGVVYLCMRVVVFGCVRECAINVMCVLCVCCVCIVIA